MKNNKRKWLRALLMKEKYKIISAVAGGYTVYSIYSLKKTFERSVPTESSLISKTGSQYIFPVDPEEDVSFIRKHFSRWWQVNFIMRPIAIRLFEEIRRSINMTTFNDESLRKFAKFTSVLDSECNHFSICMDLRTAIALARCGADPKLFVTPRIIPKDNKDYYGNKFRFLFQNLPNENIHETLSSLIAASLKMYHPTETEREDRSLEYYSGFESDFNLSQNPVKGMSEAEFLKICLQGVVSHSRIYERIEDLLSHEVLDLLIVITREYQNNPDIMSLVLKVLANLSCNIATAQAIKDTGCLKILAETAQSSNVKLALPAKRALHNLDRRGTSPILPPGMYQLHPEYGCNECSYDYDVVFIHGLLGGVFRTWRRHDLNPSLALTEKDRIERETRKSIWKSRLFDLRSKSPLEYNPASLSNPDEKVRYPTRRMTKDGGMISSYEEIPLEADDVESSPTQCWPRDWLPKDCPKGRVIGVDFESFFSRWMTICPIETTERRLKDRSNELLKKLQDIGIGKRPVVWVTHSMGGLLLKSLLCQAAESEDIDSQNICSNTKGIIFCSVPHFGTDMAVLNTARRWLILPTEEIDELSNETRQLSDLNDSFMKLYDEFKFKILSFGEVLETRTGLGMKFKLVSFFSSDIGVGEYFPLRLDHLGTCKPWSRGSFLYLKTVEFVKDVCSVKTKDSSSSTSSSLDKNSTSSYLNYIRQPFSNVFIWVAESYSKFYYNYEPNENLSDNAEKDISIESIKDETDSNENKPVPPS